LASTGFTPVWTPNHFAAFENELIPTISECCHPDQRPSSPGSSTSLANFVGEKFIPEYVAGKRSAGRAHFQAILKLILTPRVVDPAFGVRIDRDNIKLKTDPGWPYLDRLHLDEVTTETIQNLISAAIKSGYSTQMATHIRSVVSAIFNHAIEGGVFSGMNPATDVVLPTMSRKKAHVLTLSQLKQVMHWTRYPEREIVLFVILTDMNVAEICGLQWKFLNFSADQYLTYGHRIPPGSIAVWNQSYRGEFGPVMEKRKRLITIPDMLCSMLQELKRREKFTTPNDFVLTSRTGSPISPDNVTARRLKSIGKALDMPWLSWNVFRRTQIGLKRSGGRHWLKELERILPLDTDPIRF
jgi:site-specific recombinase XerD